MKVIKVIDEDTLEMREVVITEEGETDEEIDRGLVDIFSQALNCDPDVFTEKYRAYKKATEEFEKLYVPFKENIIELHKTHKDLPKTIIIGGTKLTYVSPSTRNTIDSKKLKEEEPELAKKFTKTSNVRATVRIEEV